jgi:hypothetical protein
MHYYAGKDGGDFYSIYYCETCAALKTILDEDWTEGISDMTEVLDNWGISEQSCPFWEPGGATDTAAQDYGCDGTARSGDVDSVTFDYQRGKICYSCTCERGNTLREWEIDMLEAAQKAADDDRERKRERERNMRNVCGKRRWE